LGGFYDVKSTGFASRTLSPEELIDIGRLRYHMYRKQEIRLAILCFIVAFIMLYGAVKGYLRYVGYFG